MTPKYEFVPGDTLTLPDGVVLQRIRSVRTFNTDFYGAAVVYAGILGGYIEKESNLSHDGGAWVNRYAQVRGNAKVIGNAQVFHSAQVYGSAIVTSDAKVFDCAQVYGLALIGGAAEISNNAKVYGNAAITSEVAIQRHALVGSNLDWLTVGPVGSRDAMTTFYVTENGLYVSTGCFNGSLEEFRSEVCATHGSNSYADNYLTLIDWARGLFKSRGVI